MKRFLLKKVLSKKLTFLFVAALICLTSTAAFLFANADFSGEWKLNEQKSELGQYGRMAARTIKITSQPDAISFERNVTAQNGEERTVTEKLTFDGKETESAPFGTAKKKSTAKWTDDGQTLNVNSVITFDRNGETMEIKVAEAYKLIDNGQGLSIESNSTSSFGTNTMKLVYDKVK